MTTTTTAQRASARSQRAPRTPRAVVRNAVLVTFLIFLAVYPALDSAFGFGKMGAFPAILIFTVLALGLNIVVGFAGLLDLGYAAFFAIGGYTAAFLTSPISPLAGVFQVNFYVAMLLAFIIAATFGIILGAPTLRLRGDYLAIVTLAFGEIVPRVFLNLDKWTYGSKGMNPIGRPVVPAIVNGQLGTRELFNSDQTAWYYLIFAVGVLSVFAIYRLANSRIGRAWMAMREDELAASAMGINLVQTKLLAFAMGASFSGFAGAIFASIFQFIDPFQFEFSISIMVLAMVILGGLGNVWGVLVGGLVLGLFDRGISAQLSVWLRSLGAALNVPALAGIDLSRSRLMIFGLALVLLMLLRPEGLFPSARRRAELHRDEEEATQHGELIYDVQLEAKQ